MTNFSAAPAFSIRRRVLGSAITIAIFLTGCSPDHSRHGSVDPGWHHTWDEYRNWVQYGFGDGEKTTLTGDCVAPRPSFIITGGNYDPDIRDFTLVIDGRVSKIPIWQGEHGGGLLVDDPTLVNEIAEAKHFIDFQVGNWSRRVVPFDHLERFIIECRDALRRDPNQQGYTEAR